MRTIKNTAAAWAEGISFDGVDTMVIGHQNDMAWVKIDGLTIQIMREEGVHGGPVVWVNAYRDTDPEGADPVMDMEVPSPPRRSRVVVAVEVEIDTTPGEASEPGNVIMAAEEAVRDGEGTVIGSRIIR